MYRFDYAGPVTVAEALKVLSSAGEDAAVLAGGQSLMILLRQQLVTPAVVVGLRRISELAAIHAEDGRLQLGAMATYAQVAAHPAASAAGALLSRAAGSVGSVHIRNRGTVGGSAAHADPAGDVPAVLLALGADLVIAGPATEERRCAAAEFFTGLFQTQLQPGELLVRIEVPEQPAAASYGYRRFLFRDGEYPMCVAAVRLEWADGRCSRAVVAAGGASDHPVRLAEAEQRLAGQLLRDADPRPLLRGLRDAVSPMTDVRGTARWKARVVEEVVADAVAEAAAALPGRERQ
jgi:carbon-monoxide dehydrogenase medium subunit